MFLLCTYFRGPPQGLPLGPAFAQAGTAGQWQVFVHTVMNFRILYGVASQKILLFTFKTFCVSPLLYVVRVAID